MWVSSGVWDEYWINSRVRSQSQNQESILELEMPQVRDESQDQWD